MTASLDLTDLKILDLLQADACLQNTELAKKIGLAPSAVLERVKKLEQKRIIQAYHTRIDPVALDLKLLAFIFIRSSEGPGDLSTAEQLRRVPEVLELHHIAGEDCYLAKIRAKDPQDLARLIRDCFGKIRTILSTKTTIVLETMKEENILPVPKEI
jgi:Lrp/AsnC family transcriptional regulator, leucine-responsive regulatory protein